MKEILYTALVCFTTTLTKTDNIELTVSNSQHTKMPITIIVLDEKNEHLVSMAQTIKKDLSFTDQFEPHIITHEQKLTKKELRANIQQLACAGTPLALCIDASSPQTIDYHLYDTMSCKALEAKRYTTKKSTTKCAHTIADQARKTLTGHGSLFSSRIAYCKDAHDKNGKAIRKIYIADYDGSNEELILDSSTMVIAPRWGKHQNLFYSEYTDTSIQLKSVKIKKRKQVLASGKNITHFSEGITMMMSLAPNGTSAFCASQGKGNCQIYINKDGALKRCTNNNGNNDSPVFIDNERLCFCSNFQTGSPQIYIGNIATGHLQRITHGGYCASPAYCATTNQIAYHQMIRGTMQLMVYDCTTKKHTQLTHNNGNKHEVSWSPDGSFLLYSHEGTDNSSRLQTFNLLTKTTKYLTKGDECSTYPNWSPHCQLDKIVQKTS